MESYKSLEYLVEIKNNNFLTDDELTDVLQYISYILADNGYADARYFIDEIMDLITDKKIKL